MAKGVPIQGKDPLGKAKYANVTESGDLRVQLSGDIVKLSQMQSRFFRSSENIHSVSTVSTYSVFWTGMNTGHNLLSKIRPLNKRRYRNIGVYIHNDKSQAISVSGVALATKPTFVRDETVGEDYFFVDFAAQGVDVIEIPSGESRFIDLLDTLPAQLEPAWGFCNYIAVRISQPTGNEGTISIHFFGEVDERLRERTFELQPGEHISSTYTTWPGIRWSGSSTGPEITTSTPLDICGFEKIGVLIYNDRNAESTLTGIALANNKTFVRDLAAGDDYIYVNFREYGMENIVIPAGQTVFLPIDDLIPPGVSRAWQNSNAILIRSQVGGDDGTYHVHWYGKASGGSVEGDVGSVEGDVGIKAKDPDTGELVSLAATEDSEGNWILGTYDAAPVSQNLSGILLPSAERTSTPTIADRENIAGRGVMIIVDVTAKSNSPSLTLKINTKDPASQKKLTLLESEAITGTGTFFFLVYPGVDSLLTSETLTKASIVPLGREWNVEIEHGNSDSITYSVGYQLLL